MDKEKSETMLISLILVIVFLLAGIALVSIRDNREDIRDLKREIASIEKQLNSHVELFEHMEEKGNVYKALPDSKNEK